MKAKSVDVAFGRVVRQLRLAKGVTQQQLGDAIGISYQQIQKYEHGTNRVAISTLFAIAEALQLAPSALLLQVERDAEAKDGKG